MARIPARQASSSDRERLRTLEESLERVVFGQQEAVHLVAQSIKRSRAGLGLPERPAGCFLFTGPTGVGKTELAKQLALLLGNEFTRYDMSEYMEKHAVARLIGAPPGYVGFEQGGLLVDAVRSHPYSVVLLDEIEKAHPDIYNILLQVMDHATLTDNTGRKADFRNVVLILTSNAGSREMSAKSIGFAGEGTGDERDEAHRRAAAGKSKAAIERVFSPEFRNRLDAIVTFKGLTPAVMETIVEKFILQLESQLAERHVAITLTPEARTWLAEKGYDAVFGARPLARVVQREVRDPLTNEILFGQLENGGTVTIAAGPGGLQFQYQKRRRDRDWSIERREARSQSHRPPLVGQRRERARRSPTSPGSSRPTSRSSKNGSPRRTPSSSRSSRSIAALRRSSSRRARGCAKKSPRTSNAAAARCSSRSSRCSTTSTARSRPPPIARTTRSSRAFRSCGSSSSPRSTASVSSASIRSASRSIPRATKRSRTCRRATPRPPDTSRASSGRAI